MFQKMLFMMCATHVTSCYLDFINGNHHSQHRKIYKNQKLEKKMEGDTKDSRPKRERNRLDQQKRLKKNEKDVKKEKLIDTQGESNISTVAEELVLSENIASKVWVARYILMILLLSLMKYTIKHFPTNCQTTWSYSRRSIEIYKLNDSLGNNQK